MKKVWILMMLCAFSLCGCHSARETEPVTEATAQAQVQMTETLETKTVEQTQADHALTADELAQLQSLFDDPMGWYARALTSRYETAADADLEKLFYCGAGDTPVSEAERAHLQSLWEPGMFDFDIVRCDETVMEEALQSVFGMGIGDMSGVGLENMTRYNGAYFRASSDVLITLVRLERGVWVEDSRAELFYASDEPGVGTCCVTMQKLDDRWVILSNIQID